MLVKTFGSAVFGVDAHTITIEVNVGYKFGFELVGMADRPVQESRHRIETAFFNLGLDWPRRRIIINMAPADRKKEGSAFDLPIAVGILAASDQIDGSRLGEYLIMGELSLDGSLVPLRGALPMAIQARREGFKGILLPAANAAEASIVDTLDVIPVRTLTEAAAFMDGQLMIEPLKQDTRGIFNRNLEEGFPDFSEVKGQRTVKRSLEVAAAGGHNVIMIGPPGAGKTMLARRMPGIMPPMSLQEALETTKIHSVAGKLEGEVSLIARRPFRSPHHTISDVALVGGGGVPQPGEISLAHNGVLFLDELPEFKRSVLEVLRQPLEERRITVSRARFTVEYPANFMLVASMNPCPCGYYNHPERECICGAALVQRYMGRISGPLMDRIDMHIEVTPVGFRELSGEDAGEKSADIRARVLEARERQQRRFAEHTGIHCNAMMPPGLMRQYCRMESEAERLLGLAMDRLGLSARAYDRILKVARTHADLGGRDELSVTDIAEAVNHRTLDRDSWGFDPDMYPPARRVPDKRVFREAEEAVKRRARG